MGIRSRITALFATAACAAVLGILWPVAGTASPARVTGSASYADPSGDSGDGPDVTAVDVSDDSSGKISFTSTIANRPALTDVDGVQAFFDTDKSASTGNSAGFDYDVGWIEGHQVFMHWDGSQFAEQKPPSSFKASYKDGKATFSIEKSDFGGSPSFYFIVTTTGDTGDSTADRAPNGTAVWAYPAGGSTPPPAPPPPPGSPPPPPPGSSGTLATSKFKVGKAHPGRRFTVSMVVKVASTNIAVKTTVSCSAKLGKRALRVTRKGSVLSGRAACTWLVPANTKGQVVKGSITAAYQGAKARRTFATRVRP